MSLKLVRNFFVEGSGRRDLDNNSLTGANWFINAGQRYLDSRQDTPKSQARHVVPVVVGQYVVHVPALRALEGVWIVSADGTAKLTKKSLEWIRTQYRDINETATSTGDTWSGIVDAIGDIAPSTITFGTPAYYAAVVSQLSPIQNESYEQALRYGAEGVMPGDQYAFRSVILWPPPEAALSVEVKGQFFSPTLTEDGDKSFWTEICPMALVAAALMMHEVLMRNAEGVRDQVGIIDALLRGIDSDLASEDSTGELVMEG